MAEVIYPLQWPKMAECRNMRHDYISHDATHLHFSKSLFSLIQPYIYTTFLPILTYRFQSRACVTWTSKPNVASILRQVDFCLGMRYIIYFNADISLLLCSKAKRGKVWHSSESVSFIDHCFVRHENKICLQHLAAVGGRFASVSKLMQPYYETGVR